MSACVTIIDLGHNYKLLCSTSIFVLGEFGSQNVCLFNTLEAVVVQFVHGTYFSVMILKTLRAVKYVLEILILSPFQKRY